MKTNTDKTIITMAIVKVDDEYQGRYYIDGKLDENKTVYEDDKLQCRLTLEATFYKLSLIINNSIESYDESEVFEDYQFGLGELLASVVQIRHPQSWEIQAYSSLIPKCWR